MLNISQSLKFNSHSSRGVAAVEFAIIALLFFILLFGILEFGRLFYVFNTVQEVTRRGAREAVVRWTPLNEANVKQLALFGNNSLIAGAEITTENITIDYLNLDGESILDTYGSLPVDAADNITKCVAASDNCIAYVQVSVTGATYAPMVGLFPFLAVPIPESTVIMPAESMGYGD